MSASKDISGTGDAKDLCLEVERRPWRNKASMWILDSGPGTERAGSQYVSYYIALASLELFMYIIKIHLPLSPKRL